MKYANTTTAWAVLALLSGAIGVEAHPAQGDCPPSVSVNGEAEVLVEPDEVVLTLGVETLDVDLGQAQTQSDERAKKIIADTIALGVEPKHIKTAQISIQPVYEHNYGSAQKFLGYQCRKTIVVTIKQVAKFESVLTAALQAGATYVHGVQFRTTEFRKYSDEARTLAIKAAREKAVALARELGQNAGNPISIQEERTRGSGYSTWGQWGRGSYSNVMQDMGGVPHTDSGAIAPGQIAVTARVTVAFELKPGGG